MLNCEICAQTQHHCCKASIAFNIMEVIDLMDKAKKLGIDVKIKQSPDKQDAFNLIKVGSRNVKSLDELNCIFLLNGKCQIYAERPGICRVYGSEMVKCWFYKFDYDTSIDRLFKISEEEVKSLTNAILEENQKTAVEFFNEHMKK